MDNIRANPLLRRLSWLFLFLLIMAVVCLSFVLAYQLSMGENSTFFPDFHLYSQILTSRSYRLFDQLSSCAGPALLSEAARDQYDGLAQLESMIRERGDLDFVLAIPKEAEEGSPFYSADHARYWQIIFDSRKFFSDEDDGSMPPEIDRSLWRIRSYNRFVPKSDDYYPFSGSMREIYLQEDDSERKVSLLLPQFNGKIEESINSLEECRSWLPSENGNSEIRVLLAVKPSGRDFRGSDLEKVYQTWLFFRSVSLNQTFIYLIILFLMALSLLPTTWLVLSVGWRRQESTPILRDFDRIPLGILIAFVGLVIGIQLSFGLIYIQGLINPFREVYYDIRYLLLFIATVAAAVSFNLTLCIIIFLTIVNRIKCHAFWRTTLVGKFWRFVRRCFRSTRILGRDLFAQFPVVLRLVLGVVGLVMIESLMLWYAGHGSVLAILLFSTLNLFLLVIVVRSILHMRRIHEGSKIMAAGKLDYHIKTDDMFGMLREHADRLNAIREGMAAVIAEQLKSERMRTDLIANVSHDIRTPLTSIMNYSDLLSREDLGDGQAKDYLEVIQRQAQRLRRLSEELVEAARVSSGNVQLFFSTSNISEIVAQAAAEYDEALKNKQLILVQTVTDQPLHCVTDGKQLWRVLDNLLSNVLKYALPGTRVYLDSREEGERILIRLRNISAAALDISVDELRERFVRADTSRGEEGAGLGLAIADSMMTLLHGELKLQINGDLFIAELVLPKTIDLSQDELPSFEPELNKPPQDLAIFTG